MEISETHIETFRSYLIAEEKSPATLDKYIRDVKAFYNWSKGTLTKDKLLEYKNKLIEEYAPASVNSIISSLNSFFEYFNRYDLKLKALKIQKRIFSGKEKELTRAEYEKLLTAAKSKKNQRLYLLIQTICSTGIRVSELKYITVRAIKQKHVTINLKGKMRYVILPKQLCEILKEYVIEQDIKSGPVFITRTGKPLDRSNIWSDMKKLCETAGVSKDKVFPHNLRHLFARTYYSIEKDIVRLADILGHSSINTTRIYTMESGDIHRKQIERLHLLRC